MAIINSYPSISTLDSNDLFLVCDTSVQGNPTKTASISDIVALIPPIVPGGGTMSDFKVAGDNPAMNFTISNGETLNLLGGTYITTTANPIAGDEITITHDATTRTDTTSSASPAAGATFTCVDSITQNATGHPTAVNVKTVTMPALTFTSYVAKITQSGSTASDAPVPTVIHNDTGSIITWSRSNTGDYRASGINATSAFIQVTGGNSASAATATNLIVKSVNPSQIQIVNLKLTDGTAVDGITLGYIEIRVYS